MRWIVALLLFAIPCFPEEKERSPCNAQNRGRLWPEQANTDPALARQALHCGELQMCSLGTWKYGWQPLTVHISQLGIAPNRKIPGCYQGAEKAARQRADRAVRQASLTCLR